MHWLIINTESFSPNGAKAEKNLTFDMLPKVLLLFLKVFHYPFIILDESSRIKSSVPMAENKKSTRCRMIKLLSGTGERAIMTGTLKSKSPLNVVDQYGFLDPGIFWENMYEFAERYCIMITIRVGRGRRVVISESDWTRIRKRLVNAYARGGDTALRMSKASIFKEVALSEENMDWIMAHKLYTPFIHQDELHDRIAPYTMWVSRRDVFNTNFERFVDNPIVRYAEATTEQKSLMKEFVELGFTDDLTLGKAAALELLHRLQDVCNGFNPVLDHVVTDSDGKERRIVRYDALKESPKLSVLMDLIDEIDPDENQIAIFSARTNFTEAIQRALDDAGIAYVHYGVENNEEAERKFQSGEARIFLSNQQPSAYGLNCLAKCCYAIYACADHRAEIFYQSKHRLLRGQLTEPKFAYHICMRASIEEKIIRSLGRGIELINETNNKNTFLSGGDEDGGL